jgi:uncharacterized protein (TIGR03083 family)
MDEGPHEPVEGPAIGEAVAAERLALCDLLDGLADDDWATPSLCEAWTVREVVAHLTLATRDTAWDLVKGAIRARGNWDRMNTDAARDRAQRFAPAELVGQLRETAASTRRAPMSSPLDPLTDVLVHGQDIARPVGRVLPMDPAHVVPALDHAVASRWYGGAKRFRDVTLVATDADWSFGAGAAEVRGTTGDLLLVATGRRVALAGLTGPGVEVLADPPG